MVSQPGYSWQKKLSSPNVSNFQLWFWTLTALLATGMKPRLMCSRKGIWAIWWLCLTTSASWLTVLSQSLWLNALGLWWQSSKDHSALMQSTRSLRSNTSPESTSHTYFWTSRMRTKKTWICLQHLLLWWLQSISRFSTNVSKPWTCVNFLIMIKNTCLGTKHH